MRFHDSNLRKAERYCRRHSQRQPLYIYWNPEMREYEVYESPYGAMPWMTRISEYYMGSRISQSYATVDKHEARLPSYHA